VAGVEASDRVSHALSDISGRTSKVASVMNEIVAASDQQREGIAQVNTAITQMSVGTQAAAANAEESAAAAEELSGQAQTMQEVVSAFAVGGAPGNRSTPSVAVSRPSPLVPPSVRRKPRTSDVFAEF
jgi:methyl-accepting chemotaxis protein